MQMRYLQPYRDHAIGDVVAVDDFPVADILRQRGIVELIEEPIRRVKRREKAAHFTGVDQ